jgi:hypothetical protein
MGEHLGDAQHLRINSTHSARQIDRAGIGNDPEKRVPDVHGLVRASLVD